jgi:hypothetical protein
MFDFTKSGLSRAEPVPPGIYDITIATADATTSGAGHTSLLLAGEIADGPHQGRKISDNLMLASTDEQRLAGLIRRGLQVLGQFLDAVGASEEERKKAGADLLQLGRLLKGRTVRVTTGVMVDQRDGTKREIILKVEPSPLEPLEQVIG